MTEPVYAIAQIDVKDQNTYITEYGLPLLEMFDQIGAEVLAATDEGEVLEGERSGNWTVIIKFPSSEAANNWYKSEDYAPLKKARIERLSNSGMVMLVPGFDPSLLG